MTQKERDKWEGGGMRKEKVEKCDVYVGRYLKYVICQYGMSL